MSLLQQIFAYNGLVNTLISFSLVVFVTVRTPKRLWYYFFIFLNIALAVWSFGYWRWLSAATYEQALFWARILSIGSTLIPIAYLHWILFFIGKTKGKWKILLFFGYLMTAVFLIFSFSPLFVATVEPVGHFLFWPQAGLLYHFYILFSYIGLLGFGSLQLILSYRTSSGIQRTQIKYIILGLVFGILGGFTNFPAWYGINLPPYGNVVTPLFFIACAYAAIKLRPADIRLTIKRSTTYIVSLLSSILIAFLFWYFLTKILILSPLINDVSALIVGIIVFNPLSRLIQKIANKYLYVSLYNAQQTLAQLAQELNRYLNLKQIIDLIVNTIKQTMQLDRAGVLLLNPATNNYQIVKTIGFNTANGVSLVRDNFLTQYLNKNQKPLLYQELIMLIGQSKNSSEKANLEKLKTNMRRIEASLCLPLVSKSKLIGIIVLGSKISKDAYTKEDVELLNMLSNQAGIAIDNARLYSQVQDFNKTLNQKVNEQTKDLLQTNKELKLKNQLNEELLNMKSDFLRVVNHQMNTPLSVMRSAYAMVKDGTFNAEKGMEYSTAGLERMSQTIYDFWDAFRLEGEKMEMKPEPVDLTTVIDKLVEEKKKLPLAIERKLTLSVSQPNFKVPLVWCDPKKIIHVASNLLDNAVFYTEKGGVTASYELLKEQNQNNKDRNQTGGFLKVNIKDTGVGVSKENKERLFKKFSRGLGATGLHPDGSGLGLYIAKKIVGGNDGELTYQSEGVGKGSTFSFTLPLYTGQKPPPPNQKDLIEEKANAIMADSAKNRTLR